MVTPTDVTSEIARLMGQMSKKQLIELLDEARWLLEDGDRLTDEEVREIEGGFEEIDRGESVSLEEHLQSKGE